MLARFKSHIARSRKEMLGPPIGEGLLAFSNTASLGSLRSAATSRPKLSGARWSVSSSVIQRKGVAFGGQSSSAIETARSRSDQFGSASSATRASVDKFHKYISPPERAVQDLNRAGVCRVLNVISFSLGSRQFPCPRVGRQLAQDRLADPDDTVTFLVPLDYQRSSSSIALLDRITTTHHPDDGE